MNNLVEVSKALQEIGAELLPDTATHKLRISIKSESSNRKYVVSKRDSENCSQFECSCPGWTMHMPRQPCKHLRAMIPALEQIAKLYFSTPKTLAAPAPAPVVKVNESVAKKADVKVKAIIKVITKKTTVKAIKTVAKKVAKKVNKPVAKKVVKKATKKVIKSTKPIAKKITTKVAKKATKKIVKKSTKKVIKKAIKR